MKNFVSRFFISNLKVIIPSQEYTKNFRSLSDENFLLYNDLNKNSKDFDDISVLAFYYDK